MIEVQQALELLERHTQPLASIEVDLAQALGHVLESSAVADRDFPPTDRSAMDGYALRSADASSGRSILRIAGEVRAGQAAPTESLEPGAAIRVFTGAVIPPGADAVVMVEQTEELGQREQVRIQAPVTSGQHIRKKGQDQSSGATVLHGGALIGAPEIAALASIGVTRLRVHRKPTVRVMTTGDEIVEPDRTPADHQVRNSNSPTLLAQLEESGFEGRYLGIAGDSPASLETLVRRGLRSDVLLITGGVSVGEYDLVGQILERTGMELLFHKVAMKPGKPILAGRHEDCLVIGLPGNPLSTYCGFAVFAAPILKRLAGYRQWRNTTLRVRLTEPLKAKPGRVTYHLARFSTSQGEISARRIQSTGSGDVLSMSRSNGFLITGIEGADLPVGEWAEGLLWTDFLHR